MLNVSKFKKDISNQLGIHGEEFCFYGEDEYICDVISYIADANIDIYNYELFKWLPGNYKWVNEAIFQGLCTKETDIIRIIQAGQYECYLTDLYKNLDIIMLNYCLNYIENNLELRQITQEQYNKIKTRCTNVDSNNTLSTFVDFLKELFNKEEK